MKPQWNGLHHHHHLCDNKNDVFASFQNEEGIRGLEIDEGGVQGRRAQKGAILKWRPQNFRIFWPPCHCPIHATYQYYCHVLTNPPPSPSVRTSFKYRPQLQNLGLFMCVVAYWISKRVPAVQQYQIHGPIEAVEHHDAVFDAYFLACGQSLP